MPLMSIIEDKYRTNGYFSTKVSKRSSIYCVVIL